MKIKIKYSYKLLLFILIAAFIAFGFLGDDRNGIHSSKPFYKLTSTQQSGKIGDAYGMNVNNIWLPLNSKGIIAAVDIDPNGSGGQFAGGTFLFSSGFFLSGYRGGQLWANACASATLVEDYVPGIVGGESDPNAVLYVLNSQDVYVNEGGTWVPHQSWIDWQDAVALGADFYDGNGDSLYTPNDLNQNGEWDPDEDRPDLIGDETVWCVFNDGLPVAQRRWNTSFQVGVEIRQTVFAFASAGAIGNLIFVRYRFKYVGINENDPDELTDVLYGVWADPDVGDHTDDVVGVDVPRNAGYTYNKKVDDVYGAQVPCFMIDFFSGPRAYIPGETYIDEDGDTAYTPGVDTPLDTAYSVRGQVKGIAEFPGAKNLPISSFVEYINGDPNLNDPNTKEEARFYMEGRTLEGEIPDPCTWPYGNANNFSGCDTTDVRFWFSGDPVTNRGWLCINEVDQRQMTNTGPFVLKKNVENEIVLAYVVGRGANPLDGVTQARAIDDGAQNIFDLNFLAPTPPPAPRITLSSSDDFIDIMWNTPNQVEFMSQTPTWDLRFEGYQVWAFKTNIAEDIVSGEENSALIARYDLNNFIQNVYKENSQTGGIELLYEVSPPENQLDYSIYADQETGRIRLRIFNDPFSTGQKIVKGRPYYFAVTSYALNYDALVFKNDPNVAVGDTGDYYLNAFAFAQEAENIRSIVSIVVGEDSNNPPVLVQPANQVSGHSTGNVGYDVINNAELTSSQYEVTFFRDSSSELYQMYWRLENVTTGGPPLVDSSLSYLYGDPVVNEIVTEGFITKVEEQNATIGTPEYFGTQWFTDFYDELDPNSVNDGTGVTYVGGDILSDRAVPTFPGKCPIITVDRLRKVELRFDTPGKAYRYINGYLSVFALNSYRYAPGITPDDTVGRGPIGNWDAVHDRPNGWVDVPFTAWSVDENFGTEQQLAVGFVERARNLTYPNGTPDGVWDPTTDLLASGEIILIFDSPYDPNGGDNPYDPNSGGQIEFTGGAFSTPGGEEILWADLTKTSASAKRAPEDATNITEQQRTIFNSKWFNTLYVVGFQKDNGSFYTQGDKLEIPISVYPYTEEDVYQFSTTAGGALTEDQQRALWEKVNVYPNPLYGYNNLTNYYSNTPDEPFVTFTNLPEEVTIKIYSLSGTLLRTLTIDDKDLPTSPYLRWDLQNESELRVASGMYLAIVSSPKYGDKILKFAIIMPQKQIQRF